MSKTRMFKSFLIMSILSALLIVGNPVFALGSDQSLSVAERTAIFEKIKNPELNVVIQDVNGSVSGSLKYFIESLDTGAVLAEGTTTDGTIKETLVPSKVIQEAVSTPDRTYNFADFALRIFDTKNNTFAMHFFSIPTFQNNVDVKSISDGRLQDLEWIHQSHFGDGQITLKLRPAAANEISQDGNYLSTSATVSCTLVGTESQQTRVGEVHATSNAKSSLTVTHDYTMNIDVMVDGSANGQLSKMASNSTSTTWNYSTTNTSSAIARIVAETYEYGKYDCIYQEGSGFSTTWEEIRAHKHIGPGDTVAWRYYGLAPITSVNDSGYGYIWALGAYDSHTRTVENGYRFGAAATAFAVTVGANIAYKAQHSITFSGTGVGNGVYGYDKDKTMKMWYLTNK
jgi:hypothetical protein